jgi:hypothetical protein
MKPILDGKPVQPLPPTDSRFVEGGAASRVPDVVGRSQNDARAILERANWEVSTRTVDNRAPKGTVVGQNPRGTALPGETILLQISSGEVPPPPPAPSSDDEDNGDNGGDNGDNGGDNGDNGGDGGGDEGGGDGGDDN